MQGWEKILKINYWAIFSIASDLLDALPQFSTQGVLEKSLDLAVNLAQMGATRLTELSSRLLRRLITDRMFLATFYTLPSSASLLAQLAFSRLEVD